MALARSGFVLAIKPVSVLLPHEEVIQAHVEGLASEMKKDGVQKDPMIVDRETNTVLDGMHRLAAFESLNIENAVCCSVDYSSKAVALGRWARVYKTRGPGTATGLLKRIRLTKSATFDEAFRALESRDCGLAAFTARGAFVPDERMDLSTAVDAIVHMDAMQRSLGWERTFVPEDDVDVPLQSESNLVVLMRRLGKDDVVKAARSRRLFPCKTSMHRIDPRPVAVNFPLKDLEGATSAKLREALAGREERLLPPGSRYEGRVYKERLLILDRI